MLGGQVDLGGKDAGGGRSDDALSLGRQFFRQAEHGGGLTATAYKSDHVLGLKAQCASQIHKHEA
jgi:hypothetical protein